MNFRQRLKKDKKFRFTVIAIAVLLLFMYNANQDKKEAPTAPTRQSTGACFQYNDFFQGAIGTWTFEGQTYASGILFETTKSLCRNQGCFVAKVVKEWWFDKTVCLPYVPNGFVAEKGVASEACENCVGDIYQTNWRFCKACAPGEEPTRCTGSEKEVGGILDEIWSGNNLSCKMKYYIILIVGAMIAFMLMGAIL